MMTEVYKCTPTEYYNIDNNILEMHKFIYSAKNREDFLRQKREEQKNKHIS